MSMTQDLSILASVSVVVQSTTLTVRSNAEAGT
jgi:hypothetical protein